jgi:hypothetical protein
MALSSVTVGARLVSAAKMGFAMARKNRPRIDRMKMCLITELLLIYCQFDKRLRRLVLRESSLCPSSNNYNERDRLSISEIFVPSFFISLRTD